MKSPARLPPINYPISKKDSNRITNKQDPILPPLMEKYPTGYKPLFDDMHYPNKTKDDLNDSTDNSRTEIDHYLNKLNVKMMRIRMINTNMIIHNRLKVTKL